MRQSKEWNGLPAEIKELLGAFQAEAPVKLAELARRMGVSVRASTLPVGISGEIRPGEVDGEYVIKVNRHDGTRRQRFTVAHELAHYLLHRDQIGDGIADDVLYRSSLSDAREAEANRLAADILMPVQLLATVSKEVENLQQEEAATQMAERFGVSEVAMKIRLGLS